MTRWIRAGIGLILIVASAMPAWQPGRLRATPLSVALATAAKPRAASLRLEVQPPQIKLGRDVSLTVGVSDATGRPVSGAAVTITGVSRPVAGTTVRGTTTLVVHATALGAATVEVSRAGFAPASTTVPIVPGSPATVAAIKLGVSVQAPNAKPVKGRVGTDLQGRYQALTGARQYASLSLRDGSLVDLNANTDVMIKDPLHLILSSGELFLEVVHGAVSHQVQVGTAVAATKGTRLDVRVNRATGTAVVTVIEGRVQVSNRGRTVVVGAGTQTVVVRNRPPTPPQPVNLSGILSWLANLPNTTVATVPPVLNLPQPPPVQPVLHLPQPPAVQPVLTLPQPPPVQVTLPPTGQQPTTTATDPAQGTWSGVVAVSGSVNVAAGTTLTIAPGTVVQMGSGATLLVQGTLNAQGTAAAPIVFSSASDQPEPGAWGYVALDGTGASASRLSYVQMFYGQYDNGDEGMLSVTGGAAPTISNSVFAQALQYGIWADDQSRPTIANCVFAGDATAAVSLAGEGAGLITGSKLGSGQVGLEVRDTAIANDTTWHAQDAPFLLDGGTLNAQVTLSIEAGVVLRMARGATFHVQGTLLAQGTATAPIIVTSNEPSPQPGDWGYVALDGTGASASRLSYVQMFYGQYDNGDEGMLSVTSGAAPTISNSVFARALQYGIWADDNSRPTIGNCVFAEDATAAVSVSAEAAGLITGSRLGPGQAGLEVRNTTIPRDATWHAQAAPFVLDGATVATGATLTIEAGVVLRMARGATFQVLGALLAQGTAAAPIIVTSNVASPQPGDWGYVALDGTGASASKLSYVQMFYGQYDNGDEGMLSVTGGAAPTITNSVFAEALQYGIWADDNSRPTIGNCVFAGDGSSAVSVPADDGALITGTSLGSNQAGIELRNTSIAHSGTWHQQNAAFVLDGGMLNAQVTLSIEPGVVLRMAGGASFHVEGTLLAQGTASAPIIVTSNQASPAPGDWGYVALDGTGASGSQLSYVQMFYGQYDNGDEGMLSVTGGAAPTISNSVFAQGTQYGIWADDTSRPTIGSCVFAGNASSAVSVPADDGTLITGNSLGPNQAAIELRDTSIAHGGTWHRQNAAFILDGGTLNAQVTLSIEPGMVLEMARGAAFLVQGTLLAEGTATAPIIVTSSLASPAPGDWGYVALAGTGASGSQLSYVQMFYGQYDNGDEGMLSVTGGAAPTITYSVFAEATQYGIWADDTSLPTIAYCSFQALAGSAISVPQADAARVHDNVVGATAQPVDIRSS